MILDDLFEADLPAHIKKTDLPPAMRGRLTMRDVEAERPQGAFRYRVIPNQPGESPKEFLTLQSAQQHAQAVGGRVEPMREETLSEQDVDVPGSMSVENRGALILSALEQDRREFTRNSRRPIRFNMAGEQFLINDPAIKGQILTMAQQYQKKGALDQFLLNLGQPDSLHFLLNRLAGPSDLPVGGQKSSPKAARYASEAQDVKKKSSVGEAGPQGAAARTQRMIAQLRARHPQASSDMEALMYDVEEKRQRDQQEIDRLEQEIDNLEQDTKTDLKQAVATMRQRRGASADLVKRVQAADQQQRQAIDRIARSDQEQKQAIRGLERAVRLPASDTGAEPKDDAKSSPDSKAPAQAKGQTQPAPAQTLRPVSARKTQMVRPTRREIPQQPEISRSQADRPSAKIIPMKKTEPAAQARPEPEQQPSTAATAAEPPSNVVQFRPRRGRQMSLPLGQDLELQKVAKPDLQVDRSPGIDYRKKFGVGQPDAQADMFKQVSNLREKKKPQPTNPDLWSRAKSAARSKFDVYPSAYANAWAAKWYKSKGGGWRMGKPKKK